MHVENYCNTHQLRLISLRDICDSCWLACTFSLKLPQIGKLNFTDKLALVKLFGEQPFSSLL